MAQEVNMKREKKQKEDFFDDGRVIANMNIDGKPGSLYRPKRFKSTTAEPKQKESVQLSKGDRRAIIKGIVTSYIIFGVLFFGLLAFFIVFATKVWFR